MFNQDLDNTTSREKSGRFQATLTRCTHDRCIQDMTHPGHHAWAGAWRIRVSETGLKLKHPSETKPAAHGTTVQFRKLVWGTRSRNWEIWIRKPKLWPMISKLWRSAMVYGAAAPGARRSAAPANEAGRTTTNPPITTTPHNTALSRILFGGTDCWAEWYLEKRY